MACRLSPRRGDRHGACDVVDFIRCHHIVAFIGGQRGADLAKSGASSMSSSVASVADPIEYSVDNLLRIDDGASAAKSALLSRALRCQSLTLFLRRFTLLSVVGAEAPRPPLDG